MPKPYVPSLDLIQNLDDEVRFYATIGIIVSLWGAFERTLFQFFAKASRMPPDLAALVYYQVRSDEARSEMTNQAVLHLLAGKPEEALWKGLYQRLSGSGEASRYRNLVTHNPVLRRMIIHVNPGLYRLDPSGTLTPVEVSPTPEPSPDEVQHFVGQDPVQVALGKRKHSDADIKKLHDVCADLERLHTDLDDLFATL